MGFGKYLKIKKQIAFSSEAIWETRKSSGAKLFPWEKSTQFYSENVFTIRIFSVAIL